MRGKGLITPVLIILLLLLGVGIYFFITKFSRFPNQATHEAVQSITEYPQAESWEIKDNRTLCIIPNSCSLSSTIIFETKDNWGTIYSWYKDNLTKNGWATNSIIITSLPTEMTFTRTIEDSSCEAFLAKQSDGIFAKNPEEGSSKYQFSVTCSQ